VRISIVITGRSYHTASHWPAEVEVPDGGTLDDALGMLVAQAGADARLPPSCLVAVSGRHVGTVGSHKSVALRDGDELTLIAPVAGG